MSNLYISHVLVMHLSFVLRKKSQVTFHWSATIPAFWALHEKTVDNLSLMEDLAQGPKLYF